MVKSTVLKNTTILHADGSVAEHQSIVIEDGVIVRIENNETQSEMSVSVSSETEVIDCSHLLVTPGFVNMHCHAAMNIFRGIAEDISSERWFNEVIWPYESKMTEEDVYLGTKLAIAEMLGYGVTTFSDHYFYEKTVCQAVEESGIRAVIAPTVFGSADNFEVRLAETSAFIKEQNGKNQRIEFRVGPHAPYTCPPPTLKRIIDEAKKLDVGIHLHVSENVPQVEQSKSAYGKTPFGVIAEAGGFDVPCLVAHGSYVMKEDLDLINKDTWFGTCPKTYMKLSSGTGNLYHMRHQLQYSFGTDGAASSNSLNPLEQARLFALIGKDRFEDCEDYETKEIWQALMNGHKAFGFKSGEIKEGYNADLILWDLQRPNTYPVYNPITSILYSADSTNVRYTMVAGDFLKREGELVMDMKPLISAIGKAQRELLKRGKGKAIVVYGEEPDGETKSDC